jgi:Tfp pilus assembly protein PilZ
MAEKRREARRVERFPIHIPVKLIRQNELAPEETFFITSLTELSSEGAFVATSANYRKGTVIALDFEIPHDGHNHHRVQALGKISWSSMEQPESQKSMGLGIHFVLINDEEKTAIRDFLNQMKGENAFPPPSTPLPYKRETPKA